jgi:hypothetical protein
MKMTLILFGLTLGLIGLIVAIGYFLPVQHLATRSIRLKAAPDRVWNAISDFKSSPQWRTDLKTVEQVEYQPGVFAWRERSTNNDALTYLTIEATPEKRLVRKIVDEGLPFGGTWTFEMSEEPDSTMLTITENGEVYNPVFRFVSRFVFGHYRSIDKYLENLKRYFGEK